MGKLQRFRYSKRLSEYCVDVMDRPVPNHVPAHWHDFYEIELYVSGYGSANINGSSHCIKPNTLCFFAPYDVHSFWPDEGEELYVITFMFDPNFIDSSLMNEFTAKCHCFLRELDAHSADTFIRYMRSVSAECDAQKSFSKEYVKLLTSCIIIDLLRFMSQDSFISPFRTFPLPVQKTIFYMHSHFKEAITLEDVAVFAGFSPNYTSKLLRENLGVGFKEYLTNLRLEYAERFLLLSDDSVTDIAYSSGFGSFSHFMHVFNKKYQCSPLQYRKKKSK